MKKLLFLSILGMVILFTPIQSKGCDNMPYNTYDPKTGIGYDTKGVIYHSDPAVESGWGVPSGQGQYPGGMINGAQQEANAIRNQLPGSEGSYLDGYTSVDQMQKDPGFLPAAPPVDPNAEMQKYMQQLADAKKASTIAGLDTARNNSLSSLDTEQAGIAPQYYDKRNQAAGASDVGKMNFAQFMAGRGIKGSAGAMPEIYANAGLQQQLGNLNQQEQAQNDTIARSRTGIQNNYQSDVASANADSQTTMLQGYIDQMRADRAQTVADNALMGKTSRGQTTLAGQQSEQTMLANKASVDAQAHYENIQAYINTLDPNDPEIPYLYAARTDKQNALDSALAAASVAKSDAEQQQYDNALATWKASGTATGDIASILGVPVGAKTATYDMAKIQAAISQQNANANTTNANKVGSSAATNAGSSGLTKTEQTNADYASDYSALKAMPVADAVSAMNSQWSSMLAKYGSTTAKKLWNEVLADAIVANQAVAK
jgi:hypothetical protein